MSMNMFQPSPRTTLGWPKSNVITRFCTTTPCTTISGHPHHRGYNILYHGTHDVESLYNLLHLSKAITPTLHPYYGLYLDISSRTHQWQSESLLRLSIHVINLQNKSCIPLSSPYALDLKVGFKFHHSDATPAMCGNRVDSCWCDISALRH